MKSVPLMCLFAVLLILSGCVTVPTGPSVTVFPAPGKPYDLFLSEDAYCRQAAERQIGLAPQQVVNQNAASGAIMGTAIGTGLGAALGAASGHAGTGAAIGAASGLLFGSAAGADTGRFEGREAQRRYDTAFMQCMYSYGNQINTTRPAYYRRRTVIMNPAPSSYENTPPDYVSPFPPPNTPPPPMQQNIPAPPR